MDQTQALMDLTVSAIMDIMVTKIIVRNVMILVELVVVLTLENA